MHCVQSQWFNYQHRTKNNTMQNLSVIYISCYQQPTPKLLFLYHTFTPNLYEAIYTDADPVMTIFGVRRGQPVVQM